MSDNYKLGALLSIFLSMFIGTAAEANYMDPKKNYDKIKADYYICTRSGSGAVNVREGPGTQYSKGLAEVSSRGKATILRGWQNQNYVMKHGYGISNVFEVAPGPSNTTWAKIGNNHWITWVRSDFVCRK